MSRALGMAQEQLRPLRMQCGGLGSGYRLPRAGGGGGGGVGESNCLQAAGMKHDEGGGMETLAGQHLPSVARFLWLTAARGLLRARLAAL